jgi:tetratricopeptide (TPR) repeat protein
MNLTGKNINFHRKEFKLFNPYRVLFLLVVIFSLVFVVRALDSGMIKGPYVPTPTATRTNKSFVLEAQTSFEAGNLPAAIAAYREAIALDPNDASLYAELARIQVYSSASLSTDDQRKERLQEALDTINTGVQIADDNSDVHAVKAFVLDWSSNRVLAGDASSDLLSQAEQEANRARTLDPQNTLALAYLGEISMDEMKYDQADRFISQALAAAPNLMDIHRINGQMWEIKGNYLKAIEEYEKAIEIMPNMTFLYTYIGLNYRVLAANVEKSPYYPPALEAFAKAAQINSNLGINDPIPYLQIAKTYTQMGEFFIAALNGQKALSMEPTNPDVYGQLGIIYYKGKNYETAQVALKCAVLGCPASESCFARQCDEETDPQITIEGMPLSNSTVVYYYTYGTVLAGLSKSYANNCGEAREVFSMVTEKYSSDKDIMFIVNDALGICDSLDNPTAATTGTPAAEEMLLTPTVETTAVTETPTP